MTILNDMTISYFAMQVTEHEYRTLVHGIAHDSVATIREEVSIAGAFALSIDAGTIRSVSTTFLDINIQYMTSDFRARHRRFAYVELDDATHDADLLSAGIQQALDLVGESPLLMGITSDGGGNMVGVRLMRLAHSYFVSNSRRQLAYRH